MRICYFETTPRQESHLKHTVPVIYILSNTDQVKNLSLVLSIFPLCWLPVLLLNISFEKCPDTKNQQQHLKEDVCRKNVFKWSSPV